MKLLSVKKTSMYPTIIPEDKILFVENKQLIVGDIIIFKNKNSLIAHRLIKKNDTNLITKGDNNIQSETIRKQDVLGKVLFINKKKFQNNFFQKLITYFSSFQTKLHFLYYEQNVFLRRVFKILTNPVLYIYYFKRICFKRK